MSFITESPNTANDLYIYIFSSDIFPELQIHISNCLQVFFSWISHWYLSNTTHLLPLIIISVNNTALCQKPGWLPLLLFLPSIKLPNSKFFYLLTKSVYFCLHCCYSNSATIIPYAYHGRGLITTFFVSLLPPPVHFLLIF